MEQCIKTKRGRSSHLISLRNKALAARYYYWTVIWDRSFMSVMRTLEQQEFFISDKTIQYELGRNDVYLKQLYETRPTVNELAEQYPGFSWMENGSFRPCLANQMKLF